MMKKFDKRGTAALEFCLVLFPLLLFMFVLFDLGCYAITMQSLRTLANAGARAMMLENPALNMSCYEYAVKNSTLPTGCTAPLSDARLAITLDPPPGTPTALKATASQPGFTMIFLGNPPFNIAPFNTTPSASTSVPF